MDGAIAGGVSEGGEGVNAALLDGVSMRSKQHNFDSKEIRKLE